MITPNKVIAEVTVDGPENEIPALELASFLFQFRAAYRTVERYQKYTPDVREVSVEDSAKFWDSIPSENLQRALRPFPYPRFWFDPDWSEPYYEAETLQIRRISKNSPTEITFCGVAIALTVAVIISGGSIEISKESLKCRLPALGKGIKELRNAFNRKINKEK